MQSPSNRSVAIISGLLTLVVLAGATLAIGVRNGRERIASPEPPAETLNALTTGNSQTAAGPREAVLSSTAGEDAVQDEVAAYRAQLEEAYRALDEAYAQVRALQAAQSQPRAGRERGEGLGEREGEGERRGRREHHRDADDD